VENINNQVWKDKLSECLTTPDFVVAPRDMEVRELLPAHYTVDMPAYIDLKDRKVNLSFMLAEAAMIISGSNVIDDIEKYMKSYTQFSDDGVFMRGSYGPPFVEQAGYIVDTLERDNDSRQAYMNIWRERPGVSKDIPCTTGMQFLIRGGELHTVVNMRSNDVVLGLTFDIFTFSMMSNAIRLLLSQRGIQVGLGQLTVNCGSLHLYERHYEAAEEWIGAEEIDPKIKKVVDRIMTEATTYKELKQLLWEEADNAIN
jgi:thymidylate synthase